MAQIIVRVKIFAGLVQIAKLDRVADPAAAAIELILAIDYLERDGFTRPNKPYNGARRYLQVCIYLLSIGSIATCVRSVHILSQIYFWLCGSRSCLKR